MSKYLLQAVVLAVLSACGGPGDPGDRENVAALRAPALSQQASDPTTGALRVYQAFYGRAPTATEFRAITTPDSQILATSLFTGIGHMGDAQLASVVLANMGVTSQTVNAASLAVLHTALAQYFALHGNAARGVIVNNLVGLLAGLEADVTWGASARSFNATINTARAIVAAATSTGSTCTPTVVQGFRGDIETIAASAGDSGGSSAGGDGGGAAAGGGLGKVLGGTMRVTDLSSGNVVGEGLTDAVTGLVTIRTCSLAGPFLLTLEGRAGSRYFDEGKNTLVDFPAGTVLHALVDQWDEHVGVSPVTEAAYRYALNNFRANPAEIAAGRAALRSEGSMIGLTAQQVRQANLVARDSVNALHAASLALASANTLPVPIDAGSGTGALGTSRYATSARVNGGLVSHSAAFNQTLSAPALSLAAQLAADLTDGMINGLSLDGRPVGAGSQAYELSRLPQNSMAGISSVVNRFGGGGAPLTVIDEIRNGTACHTDRIVLMSDGEVRVLRDASIAYSPPQFSCAGARPPGLYRNVLTDVISLQGFGVGQVYAVRRDGSVFVWGEVVTPQGGVASGFYPDVPQRVASIQNVTSVAGLNYYYARTSDGNVYELPNDVFYGGSGWRTTPPVREVTQLTELRNIARMRTGSTSFSYFAIDYDGAVFAWGDGCAGQFAGGTTFFRATNDPCANLYGREFTMIDQVPVSRPARISSLANVVDIASYSGSSLALHRNGTVSAWGTDAFRIFGRGTESPKLLPTRVTDLVGIRQIASTATAEYNGFLLLREDGRLVFWGNHFGQPVFRVLNVPVNVRSLGRGTMTAYAHLPDGSYVEPLEAPAVDRTSMFR